MNWSASSDPTQASPCGRTEFLFVCDLQPLNLSAPGVARDVFLFFTPTSTVVGPLNASLSVEAASYLPLVVSRLRFMFTSSSSQWWWGIRFQ